MLSDMLSNCSVLQDQYLPLDFRGSAFPELFALMSSNHGLGIDGAFVDCPETASMWLQLWCATEGLETCPDSPWRKLHAQKEPSDVHPATAISVFVVVGLLIVACVLWSVLRKTKGSHRTYRGLGAHADPAGLLDSNAMRAGVELTTRGASQNGGARALPD